MIGRYSRPELAALWDDKYRFELWLQVELAACEAMEAAARCLREPRNKFATKRPAS